MKFHQLRDFVAVAELAGVHAAARKLGISQPAVSKSIRQLEAELGMPLFERSGKGAVLNPSGRTFLARAKLAVNELQRGKDELALLNGQREIGAVSFSVFGSPALVIVPAAIAYFRRHFPNVELRIVEGNGDTARAGLNDGSLDFSLLPLPFDDPGSDFTVERLMNNIRVVAARAGHPLGHIDTLADLVSAEWVTTGAYSNRQVEFDQPFASNGLSVPNARTRCESLIALLALLVESDLLTFLPLQWVEASATRGVLMRIPVREAIDGPTLGLVRRKGLPLTTLSEAMSTALAREASYCSHDCRPVTALSKSRIPPGTESPRHATC